MRKSRKAPKRIRQEKLVETLSSLNADSRPDDGIIVCETEYSMQQIEAYSDFMYTVKMHTRQTVCYYAAGVFFLLAGGALWSREWLLATLFTVLFILSCAAPSRMRMCFFFDSADKLEQFSSMHIRVQLANDSVILSEVIPAPADSKQPDTISLLAEIPYDGITGAVECSHSFYLFPKGSGTVFCGKTSFVRGTPMGARDLLARKLGRRFRIRRG